MRCEKSGVGLFVTGNTRASSSGPALFQMEIRMTGVLTLRCSRSLQAANSSSFVNDRFLGAPATLPMPAGLNPAAQNGNARPFNTLRSLTRDDPSRSALRRAAELISAVLPVSMMRSRWSCLQFGHACLSIIHHSHFPSTVSNGNPYQVSDSCNQAASALWQDRVAQNWGHERRSSMDIKYRAPATLPEGTPRDIFRVWRLPALGEDVVPDEPSLSARQNAVCLEKNALSLSSLIGQRPAGRYCRPM